MHFGENQLSRSLIGLSPLTTGHPPGFQPWWVRASTKSYLRFTLPMARSLRFGSWARDSTALFGLAFATATPHGLTSPHTANSQAHSSKGTQSRPPRDKTRMATLPRLVGTRFQVLFHNPSPGHFSPFPHGTRALSVIREYLGLPDGPGRFTQDSSSPVLLGTPPRQSKRFHLPGSHGLRPPIPGHSATTTIYHCPTDRRTGQRRLPQPRTRNTRRLSHAHGLASSAFAHHY